MVRVSSCCCGCSLKTGTILIGVFYLVFCILSIIILSFSLIAISDKSWQSEIMKFPGVDTQAKNEVDTQAKNEVDTQAKNEVDTQAKKQGIDILANNVLDKIFVITQGILGILLAIVIIGTLLNVMLIVGAVQEKARLVYIWFVTHTILLIINAVLIIVNGIAGVSKSGSTGSSVASTIITMLLTVYFLIVVYSYYKELQDAPGQPSLFQNQGYLMQPPEAPPAYHKLQGNLDFDINVE